jgi:hypothetical protein
MKNLLPLFLLLLINGLALAQDESPDYSIKGQLQDADKKPVPFANIALYTFKDSTLIGGSTSDEKGAFTIPAAPGKYFLKITFLSLNEKIIPNVNVVNQDTDIGVVAMTSNARNLEELVIRGEKSQMDLQLDKRVFNVGKDLSNIGSNASDILNNMPSVTVEVVTYAF